MNLKINKDLFFFNSNLAINQTINQNKKIELFDIGSFKLDQDVSISSKEMKILPNFYKKYLKNIFYTIVNKSDVQNEIKKNNATSISLKIIDDKLVYKLDGSKDYKTIQDEKVKKEFKKIARKIKKYLINVGSLKEKQLNISSIDKNIIESSPSDVKKISREIFKKMKKSDTEWSIWVIEICDMRSTIKKVFEALGIKFDWDIVPKGSDDILAYLFGIFGILNGIEIKRDSKKIGDVEGQKDGRYKINRNVIAIVGGTVDLVSKTVSSVVKFLLGALALIIFIFVAIYAVLQYINLVLKAYKFKFKYNKYIGNEKLDEIQKITAALKFLKSKVTICEKEAYKIINDIRKQNPNFSDYKIKKLAHEKIAKNLLIKINRFERRVGANVVDLIQKNVDEILKNPTNVENIEKAKNLLKEVKSKNDIVIQENKWYAIATFLQVLEMVLLVIFGYTVLATISGSISSAISVIIVGAYLYRKHIVNDKKKDKHKLDENLNILFNQQFKYLLDIQQ